MLLKDYFPNIGKKFEKTFFSDICFESSKVKKDNVFFQIQRKIYNLILKEKPYAIIYHGDTYTTLATSMITNYFFPTICLRTKDLSISDLKKRTLHKILPLQVISKHLESSF